MSEQPGLIGPRNIFAHLNLSKIGVHYTGNGRSLSVTIFFLLSDTLRNGVSIAEGILESMNMVIRADKLNSVSAHFKSPVTICSDAVASVAARRQRVLDMISPSFSTPDTWYSSVSSLCSGTSPLPHLSYLQSFPFPWYSLFAELGAGE